MQQHGSKYTTLGIWSIGQNSIFSEHGHVAYQVKWNPEMQQHGSKYFARRPPMPLKRPIGQKSTFSEHDLLHINLKGIMNSATW